MILYEYGHSFYLCCNMIFQGKNEGLNYMLHLHEFRSNIH